MLAPLAGKALEISFVAGEYRNDTTAPVMTIANLRTVWVTSDVPENSLRLVNPGEQVDILFNVIAEAMAIPTDLKGGDDCHSRDRGADQPPVMANAIPPGGNALQAGSVKDCD